MYSINLLEDSRDLRSRRSEETRETERALREQFVLEIAHDLRNPLTGIRANAQLMMRNPEKLERNLLLANRIVSSTDRLDRMVSNLMDATQIRAGKRLDLELEKINLVALIQETLENLSFTYGNRFVFDSLESLTGYSNRDGMVRVLENLVSNAVKYGSSDTPIVLNLNYEREKISLSVHNEGHPIPLDEQHKLFQLFGRTESAQSSGQRGWGIGLVLVKGIVEALKGSIRVESSAKLGTTFEMVLPWKKEIK